MPTRSHRPIARQQPAPDTARIDSNVRHDATDGRVRRCDNPNCSNEVHWVDRRGRPQLFCSRDCRRLAVAAAARFSDEIRRHEAEIATGGLTYRQRRAVDTEIARLRWLLSAYPESTRPAH